MHVGVMLFTNWAKNSTKPHILNASRTDLIISARDKPFGLRSRESGCRVPGSRLLCHGCPLILKRFMALLKPLNKVSPVKKICLGGKIEILGGVGLLYATIRV